jgi:hypothetical protein
VNRDTTLSPAEKQKEISALMKAQASAHLSRQHSLSQAKYNENEKVSYHNAGKKILGCSHYKTGCKLSAPCCNKWFPCRFCHDAISDHKIDRYSALSTPPRARATPCF